MIAVALALFAAAQATSSQRPEDTEVWQPEPPVVVPGPAAIVPAPSDAVVLFDGTNLDHWVTTGKSRPRAGRWRME